jgi:hypothetical protein
MNRDIFNRDKTFQYRYNMDHSSVNYERAWCHSDAGDYCPLVIASMSVVIILSLILILYLCTRKAFGFKCCRNVSLFLRKKLLKSTSNNSTMISRNHQMRRPIYHNMSPIQAPQRPSNLEILNSLETPVTISRTSTLTSRLLNRLNNFGSFLSTNSSRSSSSSSEQNANVWFVDIGKHVRPPPSYDESQHTERVNEESDVNLKTQRSRRAMPVNYNQTSNFNGAFSLENLMEPQESRIVFPAYRCMTLTTNASTTQPTLCLIGHQPQLENNATLIRAQDEVPPPYEAVVNAFVTNQKPISSTHLNRTRSFFNAGITSINKNRFYSTMVKANTRREYVF